MKLFGGSKLSTVPAEASQLAAQHFLLKELQAYFHGQIAAIGGKNKEVKTNPLQILCDALVEKMSVAGAIVLLEGSPRTIGGVAGKIDKSVDQDVKRAYLLTIQEKPYAYLLVSEDAEEKVVKDLVALTQQALECSLPLADLLQKDAQLSEVEEVKSSFIATTSHQLRTPLSVVKWVFSVLQTDAELKKMPSQMQLINQAYEGVERVINSVNDILNVSRIQNGHIPFNPASSDLKVIIKEVLGEVDALIKSRSIKLNVKVEETLPNFTFDPILVKEAILNIVNNAIDYNSKENGEIGLVAKQKDGQVEISISNTGVGIKPVEQKKIFEPLYRSPSAAGLNPNGSGLGLYLAQAIVREHGGTLTFVSEPEKMTTFTITLPLK